MINKTLLKSIASTAAIGSVLAVAQVAAPAVASAAPQVRAAACNVQYPNSVVTTTSLTLRRYGGQYGARNMAHVLVSSDTQQTPTGQVVIRIVGVTSYTVTLSGGRAFHFLPRRLSAGNTYQVIAHYKPGCSVFKASSSNSQFYTVMKATTFLSAVHARDIGRAGHPIVRGSITSQTGLTPRGSVRVRLIKNGVVRKDQTVLLSGGDYRARFGRTYSLGIWKVKVVYLGTSNFRRDVRWTTFRIHRR